MNEPTDDTRPEVPVVADDLDELGVGFLASAVCVDEDRQGLGNADGVRELDEAAAREASRNKRLRDPAGGVRRGAVDLGEILARESSSTVRTPTTVRIDNDLTAGETGITLRTTDDETAGGLDLYIRTMMSFPKTLQMNENIRGRWCGHRGGWRG